MPRRRSSWSVKGAPRTERAVPLTGSTNGHRPMAAGSQPAPPAPERSRRVLTIALITGATLLVLISSLGVLALHGRGGEDAVTV
ncbi:MAG: hypothetical protein ACREQ5_38495, partial [Candidatus Dormibacteria bacterium]